LAGCHVYENAARTIINEPIVYLDEKRLTHQLRKDARQAWAEVCRQYPKRTFSDDFVDGFVDGYSDYLDNGGTAQMPATPPVRYRRMKFLNPEGQERIRQWYLGFKYGMDVAVDTGCRSFLTYPVVLPEVPSPANPHIRVLPSPPDVSSAIPLPAPRSVSPADPTKLPPPSPLPDKDKPAPDKDKEPDPVIVPIPAPFPRPEPAVPSPAVSPGVVLPPADNARPKPLFPIGQTEMTPPSTPIHPAGGASPTTGRHPTPLFD
jgi:hypothetical protein